MLLRKGTRAKYLNFIIYLFGFGSDVKKFINLWRADEISRAFNDDRSIPSIYHGKLNLDIMRRVVQTVVKHPSCSSDNPKCC